MKQVAVLIWVLVLVALLVAVGVAVQQRWVVTNAGNGVVYKTDRWTGNTVRVAGGTQRPVTVVKPTPTYTAGQIAAIRARNENMKPRPVSVGSISCQGDIIGLGFMGSLFNGSSYVLDSAVVHLESTEETRKHWDNGDASGWNIIHETVLSASFSVMAYLPPHNSKSLNIQTGTYVRGESKTTCKVVSAMGHPRN